MKKENAAKLEEIKTQHEMCAHFEVGGQLFVFRAPELEEWEEYQEKLTKTTARGPLYREISQLMLVYPTTLEPLQSLFKRSPAAATRIADAVTELAGADLELTVKKD